MMSTQQRVARLEELLARVQERAAAPRAAATFDAAPVAVEAAPDTSVEAVDVQVSPAAPAVAYEPEPTYDDAPEVEAVEVEVDVEVSAEVVEVEIDDEEAAALAEAEAGGEVTELYADGDEPESTDEHTLLQGSYGTAEVEPAPTSSPRPISTAPEVDDGAVAEEVPRHTPPPESGKLAAPPPEPAMPSAPPPSLEGHTLVGGWREPGLVKEGVAAPPVRVPAPARPAPEPVAPARSAPEPATPAPVAAAPAAPLRAEPTRPQIAPAAKVAAFEGSAAAFSPSSFGELLDASLGL